MKRFSKEELKANNARYLWHPMAQPKAMRETPPDIIARGEGSWIWDIDGHKMVDGVGGTTHPRAIELSTRMAEFMREDGVVASFFSNGGSDAVEGALKLARQYWKIRGQRDRTKYIALRQGYHGVHFGGMSV